MRDEKGKSISRSWVVRVVQRYVAEEERLSFSTKWDDDWYEEMDAVVNLSHLVQAR